MMTLRKYRELVKKTRKERKKPKHIMKREEDEAKIVGTHAGDASGGVYASVTVQPVRSHFEWLFPKVIIPSWDEDRQGGKVMKTTNKHKNESTKKTTQMWHIMESAKLRGVTKEERGRDKQMLNIVKEVDKGKEIYVPTRKIKVNHKDTGKEKMLGEEKNREITLVMKNSKENYVSSDRTETLDEELHKVLMIDDMEFILNTHKIAQPPPTEPGSDDKTQKENNTKDIMEEMKVDLETKEMDMSITIPTISTTASMSGISPAKPVAPRVFNKMKHSFEPYGETFELVETIHNLEDKYGYPAVYKLVDNIAVRSEVSILMKTKRRTEREVQLKNIKFTTAYLNLWKALQFYLLPLLPIGEAKPIREAKKAIKEYMRHMEEDKYRFALVLWEMLRHVKEERKEEILAFIFLKLVKSKYVLEYCMNYSGQEKEEQRRNEEMEDMEMSYSDSEKLVIDEEAMDNNDDNNDSEGEEGNDEDKEPKEEMNEKDDKDVEKCMNELSHDDQVNKTESIGEVNNDEGDTDNSETIPNSNMMAKLTTTTNIQPTTAYALFPITTTTTIDNTNMIKPIPTIAITTILETITSTADITSTVTSIRPKIRNTSVMNTFKSHTSNLVFSHNATLEFTDDDTEFMSFSRCSSNCSYSPSSSSDYNEEELQQHIHNNILTSIQSKHAARERKKVDALTDEFRLVMNATEYYKSYTGRILNHELWKEIPSLVEMLLQKEMVTPCIHELLDNISLQEWAEFCKHHDFMDSLSSFFQVDEK
ncbi:hypothetical protein E2C01_056096 [Portunus trituberculatus]|uniref:Uncharacterized protein n=1 Tax=Portunus trituberculatus TaxID=210409 RepID=A0A5B7GY08_PORTR|nr:hypothetical protein [Portunus trituberculatus]